MQQATKDNQATQLVLYTQLEDFKKLVSKYSWNAIELNRNVCKVLNSSKKFTDGINSTMELLQVKFPHIMNMSWPELQTYVPYPPTYKQFVIGTLEHQSYYFAYNMYSKRYPFLVSSAADWTEDLNKILITCGMQLNIDNDGGEFPVRILLPKNTNSLLRNNEPRVTLLEFCIVMKYINNFEIYQIPDNGSLDHIVLLLKPAGGKPTGGGSKNKTQYKNILPVSVLSLVQHSKELTRVSKLAHVKRALKLPKFVHSKTNKSNGIQG